MSEKRCGMTLYDVVRKLAGPIKAVGDHGVDSRRGGNLDTTIELVGKLIADIADAAGTADRPEASMAVIGKKASEFLVDLRESLEDQNPDPSEKG